MRLYENPSSHVSEAAQQHKLTVSAKLPGSRLLVSAFLDEVYGNCKGSDTRHVQAQHHAGLRAASVQAVRVVEQGLVSRPTGRRSF